jgi:hypothetical protein
MDSHMEISPYKLGSTHNAGGIGYGMLPQADAMNRLKDRNDLE